MRPAMDFPSYTGSVIMPSSRAVSRIASIVDSHGDAVAVAGPALEHGDLVVAQRRDRGR